MNLKKSEFVVLFLLLLPFTLFAAGKKESKIITTDDELKSNINEESSKKAANWYIFADKKMISGPFLSGRECLVFWYEHDFQAKKKINIGISFDHLLMGMVCKQGKNGWLITNNPDKFFSRDIEEISNNLKVDGYLDLSVPLKTSLNVAKYREEENLQAEARFVHPEFSEKCLETHPELIYTKRDFPRNALSDNLENNDADAKTEESGIKVDLINLTAKNAYEKKRLNLSDFFVNENLPLPETPEETSEDFSAVDVLKKDSFGRTELMKAVKEGNDWQIRNLIKFGIDVNACDEDGWTALMYAARFQSNLSIIDMLLSENAVVRMENNFGQNALLLAAIYNNNPEVLKRLLEFYLPTDKDVHKAFVQLLAEPQISEKTLLAKIKVFISIGLPLNSYYDGKTPLMHACQNCNTTKVIQLLLEKDADSTLRSTEGKTAFDYAAANNKLNKDDIYWSLNRR